MARKVYKYEVPPPAHHDVSAVDLPRDSRILCAGTQLVGTGGLQQEKIFLWAEVDPHTHQIDRTRLVIVPTGGKMPVNAVYLDTVHFTTTRLVFHLYHLNDGDREPQYEEGPHAVLEADW